MCTKIRCKSSTFCMSFTGMMTELFAVLASLPPSKPVRAIDSALFLFAYWMALTTFSELPLRSVAMWASEFKFYAFNNWRNNVLNHLFASLSCDFYFTSAKRPFFALLSSWTTHLGTITWCVLHRNHDVYNSPMTKIWLLVGLGRKTWDNRPFDLTTVARTCSNASAGVSYRGDWRRYTFVCEAWRGDRRCWFHLWGI